MELALLIISIIIFIVCSVGFFLADKKAEKFYFACIIISLIGIIVQLALLL